MPEASKQLNCKHDTSNLENRIKENIIGKTRKKYIIQELDDEGKGHKMWLKEMNNYKLHLRK